MDKGNGHMPKDNVEGQGSSRRNPREVVTQSAERWLARNRSLVLRQTPVWAQSLAAIMIGLGVPL